MQAVNKVIKNVIDREQKRVLVIALSHDGEIMLKGDNLSVSTVENNDNMKEMLKSVLQSHEDDEDETSYNFGRHLVFSEAGNFDFPKMFAKLGGRKWKGGDISKTLSKYFVCRALGSILPKHMAKRMPK